MPYDPTNFNSPLPDFLRKREQIGREQAEQRRREETETEERKEEVYLANFVFSLDNPEDGDKEIAIVIPPDKLPESLRDYQNMSQEEIRQRVGALLADENARSSLQNGQFFIDGKPATSGDKPQIYSSVRETVLNMAKSGIISVGNYSPLQLRLADMGGELKPRFDAGYKQQLEGMISRMLASNTDNISQIAALVGNHGR